MPGADRSVEEFLGTNHCGWSRIEVAVCVHDCLGTKAAHTENEDDVPDGFHDGLDLARASVAVIIPWWNVTASGCKSLPVDAILSRDPAGLGFVGLVAEGVSMRLLSVSIS